VSRPMRRLRSRLSIYLRGAENFKRRFRLKLVRYLENCLMELRDIILQIGSSFAEASGQPLANNSLAAMMRSEVPIELARIFGISQFTFKGAPDQGNWAEVPWMGVFHPEITDSATHGFYVVYLFSANLSAVYLCLGQGVTQLRSEFGRSANGEMLRRAALIRDRVPEHAATFRPGPISLGGSTQLAKDYDSAVAFQKRCPISALPAQEELENDLKRMVFL
jgi:5-methylcytosine-specific restriction enzyme A